MAEIYLMMNKPKGYVCSAASDSHKTVYELLPPELQDLVKNAKRGHRLHTIGRLDADTTGLLLLTTDGHFSHRIAASVVSTGSTTTSENHAVVELVETTFNPIPKTYKTTLKHEVSPDQQAQYITRAAQGLILPAEKKAPEQSAAPAVIKFLSPNTAEITITEGKFHEVRRIFRALGNEVSELERIAIGNLTLPTNLQPGDFCNCDFTSYFDR